MAKSKDLALLSFTALAYAGSGEEIDFAKSKLERSRQQLNFLWTAKLAVMCNSHLARIQPQLACDIRARWMHQR
eukprot:1851921-Amphidinium_carterae.2